MRDKVEEKEYKGYKINIYQDECAESPDDWGDDGLFLVGYHRDFYVDRKRTTRNKDTKEKIVVEKGISQELARCIANSGKDEEGEDNTEAKEYIKKYHIFGLEAYIHSGVVLALTHEGNFPDRQWDVSQLGLVFVAKKETRTRDKAKKLALGLIRTWNEYLSGDIYGYMIENPDGEESGGCWGFWGYDNIKSGLLESAQGEIDAAIEEDKEKRKIAKQVS